jgi:(p)ppGpp synthase/HD superfamily hydrolase
MNLVEEPTSLVVQEAKQYAIEMHRKVNQMYGKEPYEHHLHMVNDMYHQFKYLIPEKSQPLVEAALWLHDVIEDCGVTYNDVKNKFGHKTAELVYALTNEKGRDRSERASMTYYRGLRVVEFADFCKLMDRVANIKNSYDTGHSMLKTQAREHSKFVKQLYDPEYLPIFMLMNSYLNKNLTSSILEFTIWDKLNRKLDKPLLTLIKKLRSF